MKKHLLALSFAGMMLLSACGGAKPAAPAASADTPAAPAADSAAAAESIKFGIIAPTTGNVSVYGVASSNGTKLALDEINKAGGVGGKQVEYILYDDKGDSTESVNAYNKLVSNDKVSVIIGSVTSGPTATVAQASQKELIPIITPTGTAEELTKLGDNMFRACFLDSYQAQVMAGFATEELTAKTAAVLYNSADDYSTGLAENFKSKFEELGGTITAYEAYVGGDNDYKTQLTTIKSGSPQVLFLPDYYNTVALIAKQVKDLGIDSTMLGADGWDGVFTAVDDKSLIEGAYYCSHYAVDDPDPVVQDFIAEFKSVYNAEPNSFAALGYDAAKIMAAAVEKAGTDKDAITKALKETNYDGVTGNITFDEIGNPIKSVAIITVADEQAKLYKKFK